MLYLSISMFSLGASLKLVGKKTEIIFVVVLWCVITVWTDMVKISSALYLMDHSSILF